MQGKPPESQNDHVQRLRPIEQALVVPDCARSDHHQPLDPCHVAWAAPSESPRMGVPPFLCFNALWPSRELPLDGQVCSDVHDKSEVLSLDEAFEAAAPSGGGPEDVEPTLPKPLTPGLVSPCRPCPKGVVAGQNNLKSQVEAVSFVTLFVSHSDVSRDQPPHRLQQQPTPPGNHQLRVAALLPAQPNRASLAEMVEWTPIAAPYTGNASWNKPSPRLNFWLDNSLSRPATSLCAHVSTFDFKATHWRKPRAR